VKIDREIVLHIGKLAHLELSEAEQDLFAKQLQNILQYVEKLNEIKQPAEPFSYGAYLKSTAQTDSLQPCLPVDEALKNAPERVRDFFKVPRIIP
jgi:aspartyl-tRNA(Asn)/glutamyl-tRNA(Gln) amidotransferase subunit C